MKLKAIILIHCFLVFVVSSVTAQQTARVMRVKDGDTYVLQNGNRSFTVRLQNIDAPETKQSGGLKSFLFVNSLLIGKVVSYDSAGKDLYGRTLATLKLDGKRVDSIIIKNGWAWQYVNYSNDSTLKTVMLQAIEHRSGIWACGAAAACPPWLWRKYNSKSRIRYCRNCKQS